MYRLTGSPRRQIITGSMAAMAIIAAALLAVFFMASPTSAHDPDPNLNDDEYVDPRPCGIHVNDVPTDPDPEFSEGHVALFDAYWDYNTQTLNNNLCPPLAEHTVIKDLNGTVTGIVTGRIESNIDVNTTVFHAGNEFKATVVDTASDDYDASNYTGQRTIDRVKYPFLPPADTVVWWLEQDDPIAEAANPPAPGSVEEPELVLGFSAGLFDEDDWYLAEGLDDGTRTEVPPLQYELEAERDPEGNVIPFVVFENNATNPIWDSRNADTSSIRLKPGQYKHYNWVFFPGADQSHTYVLEVHLKGHVRTAIPEGETRDTWKPLTWPEGTPYDPSNKIVLESINKVVTSELVKQEYTIHVGPLTLDEQPLFGVPLSVEENSPATTTVGAVIPVFKAGSDTLTYSLSGDGHRNFTATAATGDATGAQIKVAPLAHLDYETRNSYDLVLSVSDGKDREGGPDDSVDDTIALSVKLTDDPDDGPHAGVVLRVEPESQSTYSSVTFTATTENLPAGARGLEYALYVLDDNGNIAWNQVVSESNVIEVDGPRDPNVTRRYQVGVNYYVNQHEVDIYSNAVTVTWH